MDALARTLLGSFRTTLLGTLLAALLGSCESPTKVVLLIVDQDAGADGAGAVFELTESQQGKQVRVFAESPLIDRPQDIMPARGGGFLVLDYCEELGVGKIYRFSADRTHCEELPIPKGLVDPVYFERAADGSIWIVDKNADPLGLGKQAKAKTGTLWRLSPDHKTLSILATGPPLIAPSALVFDGDDAYLLDADAFRIEPYDLKNEEGAIFKVHPHPEKLETVVRLQSLVSPFTMHRTASGQFVIVDVNADPVRRERKHGAVYQADPETGTTRLFANHDDFADPVSCLPWQGGLLVVDANADPLKLGPDGSNIHFGGDGRGAVFLIDLQSRAVELFFASPQFVNPMRLRSITR